MAEVYEAAVTLAYLHMTNGYSANSAYTGGGIWISSGGVLTLTHSTVDNSEASFGGGIANASGGSLVVLNSTIANNVAFAGSGNGVGGGMVAAGSGGTFYMENSTVSLTCRNCNYQWDMDLSRIDTYKVIKRFDGKYLRLY